MLFRQYIICKPMLVRSLMSLMRRCAISGNFINRVCDSVFAGVEVSAHVVVIYKYGSCRAKKFKFWRLSNFHWSCTWCVETKCDAMCEVGKGHQEVQRWHDVARSNVQVHLLIAMTSPVCTSCISDAINGEGVLFLWIYFGIVITNQGQSGHTGVTYHL